MEGSMSVQFTDCFIKQATIRVCLYTDKPSKFGYESKFANVIKFGKLVLSNDQKINDYYVPLKTIKEDDVLNIECNLDLIKNLFNHEKIINTELIDSDNKTLKMYQYSNNNRIMNIPLNNISEWDNSKLVHWALITFPHFHIDFVNNLTKYNLNGRQFYHMIMNQNRDILLGQLFEPSNEYLIKYIRSNYDDLVIYTNITQIFNEIMSTQTLINDPLEFYKFVANEFPDMDKIILKFVDDNKITRNIFKKLDVNKLNKVFDPIRIFQIILNLEKD